MPDTIRQQVVSAIKTTMEAITTPDAPERVVRGQMAEAERRKNLAIGIYDTEEQKRHKVAVSECTLRVVVEFYKNIPKNSEPSDVLNATLGSIQKAVADAGTFGGIVINAEELSNEIDVDGPYDRTGTGVIFYAFKYRHKYGDPYSIV